MSPSELVHLVAPAADGVEVSVADHAFATVGSGTGGVRVDVAPGVYSVRYVTGSTVKQELVNVPPGETTVHVDPPELRFDSPAPLTAATGVSPEHLKAAQRLCASAGVTLGTGAQLFIFVRDRDRRGRCSPLAGLALHEVDGHHLIDLDEAGGAERSDETEAMWAGVTVSVAPGPYRLRVRTGAIGTLEQLVFAAGGWQTQLFLQRRSYPGREGGRTADLGDAAILMAPFGRGFDPGRDDLRLTELARQALASGRAVLAESDLENMLWMKFENPMLGIYAGHMLLQLGAARAALLEEVRQNLEVLVPGHPDVATLGLAASAVNSPPFPVPPMLRASWKLVVKASAERPDLVPAGSLAARAAANVYDSSTWLIWRVPRTRRAQPPPAPARPADEEISVVDLMNKLAAAVPELSPERDRVFAQMEPVEQDLYTFAAGTTPAAAGSAPAAEGEGTYGKEETMLAALGLPKGVVTTKLHQVADQLNVRLE